MLSKRKNECRRVNNLRDKRVGNLVILPYLLLARSTHLYTKYLSPRLRPASGHQLNLEIHTEGQCKTPMRPLKPAYIYLHRTEVHHNKLGTSAMLHRYGYSDTGIPKISKIRYIGILE